MRAALVILALAISSMACSVHAPTAVVTPGPSPAAVACHAVAVPAATPGAPPPAVLQDLAGATGEFSIGSPGAHPTPVPAAEVGVPRLAGDALLETFQVSQSVYEVDRATAAGCRRVGPGLIVTASPSGTQFVREADQQRFLTDAGGRTLAKLPPDAYWWTGDGRLVDVGSQAISVYDSAGHPHAVTTRPLQVVGGLGPAGLIVLDVNGTSLLDVQTGAITSVSTTRVYPAAGSPDGRHLAGVDNATGLARISDATGSGGIVIKPPGPVLAFIFSPDSQWLAVDTRFGGVIYRVSDGSAIDLGSINVVSW